MQVGLPGRLPSRDEDAFHRARRITRSFWGAVFFAVALVLFSLAILSSVVKSLGEVAFEETGDLIAMQRIHHAVDLADRAARGFLLTGNLSHLMQMQAANDEVRAHLDGVRPSMTEEREVAMLQRLEHAEQDHRTALDRVIALHRSSADGKTVGLAFDLGVVPLREELNRAFRDLYAFQEQQLHAARAQARATVSQALTVLALVTVVTLAACVFLAHRLVQAMRGQASYRRELQSNLDRMNELNRELDAFAARVSHDLRNLLAPTAMAAALLPRAADAPHRVRALAEKIQRSVDRSLSMIDGLLAFSRSAKPEPGLECSVGPVLDEALEQLAPDVARVDATIDHHVEEAEVACSRELLTVVLLNLLGNSLKFIEGRDRRVIAISSRRSGGSCEIAIADTGPGIPEGEHARIFEPFYRVPGVHAKGHGIGLATVARIVHAHGGTIDVESKLGVGTTLRVRLPLVSRHHAGAESQG